MTKQELKEQFDLVHAIDTFIERKHSSIDLYDIELMKALLWEEQDNLTELVREYTALNEHIQSSYKMLTDQLEYEDECRRKKLDE